MQNLKTASLILALAYGLLVMVWLQRPPDFVSVRLTATSGGGFDTLEINGEPYDSKKFGNGSIDAKLRHVLEALPVGMPPQVRVQVDDRLQWNVVSPFLETIAQLDPEVELVLVETLENDITPGEDIRLYTYPGTLDESIPDLFVDIRPVRDSKATKIAMSGRILPPDQEGRVLLASELNSQFAMTVPEKNTPGAFVEVRPVGGIQFSEIRKTLLAIHGRRDASGEWIPLVQNLSLGGVRFDTGELDRTRGLEFTY